MPFLIALFILIVIVLGVIYLLNILRQIKVDNKKIEWAEKRHYTLLRIMVPKNNSKSPLAAEQMFAALHGIYRKADVMQEHYSFEIASSGQSINFYMLVPTHLRDFIEGQVYSQYPTVEIDADKDYANVALEGKHIFGADITLSKSDFFPIRTFTNFDVDPLAGITGVLSKSGTDEVLSIQAVLTPIDDSWQKEGIDYVKKIKEGKSLKPPAPLHMEVQKQLSSFTKDILKDVLGGFGPPKKEEKKKEEKKEIKLSGPEEVALKGIESKVTKLGYAMSIRVLAITKDPALSQTRAESVVGALKQFNLTNLNGFDIAAESTDPGYLKEYRTRNLHSKAFRMNIEEIASMFHFPDTSVETPSISWAGSKKGEPPQNLPIEGLIDPQELTSFGLTSFRNNKIKFGIKSLDRMLHFYAIGKTGTGKSTLIENMIYDDIKEGRGVAVIDPHGELVDHILNFIPDERIQDVVYFNPDDREYPLAFNLMENVEEDMRSIVASGLMSIFTKLWAGVWSARMEYILRNAILAALAVPNATLLSVMRLLNDPIYRKYALSFVSDPVVRDFFFNEYEKYEPKFRQEAIAPIQNKVGQFLSSSTVRNLVGQPKSTFDLSGVMDGKKIFLVDLSIGKIGEDNSKLLGSMLVTKIQLAAMARARQAGEDRQPFFLYVDEFQNFATESFATILSEARKYKLALTLVNQYIAQIPEVVADAIFGNVGSTVSFRVGAEDADRLVKQFAPVFEANDLINLPNRQIYVKMAIDGVTSNAFSAHTLPPRAVATENRQAIIDSSRQLYSRPRAVVEEEISSAAQSTFLTEGDKAYEMIRQMRPLILEGTMYKEFSAKGGDRWYFGQPPEILEEELKKIAEEKAAEAQEKEAGETPQTTSPAPELVVQQHVAAPAAPEAPSVAMAVASEPPVVLPVVAEPASLPIIANEPVAITPLLATGDGGEPRKRKRKRKKKKRQDDGGVSVQLSPQTPQLSEASQSAVTSHAIIEEGSVASPPDNAATPESNVPTVDGTHQVLDHALDTPLDEPERVEVAAVQDHHPEYNAETYASEQPQVAVPHEPLVTPHDDSGAYDAQTGAGEEEVAPVNDALPPTNPPQARPTEWLPMDEI